MVQPAVGRCQSGPSTGCNRRKDSPFSRHRGDSPGVRDGDRRRRVGFGGHCCAGEAVSMVSRRGTSECWGGLNQHTLSAMISSRPRSILSAMKGLGATAPAPSAYRKAGLGLEGISACCGGMGCGMGSGLESALDEAEKPPLQVGGWWKDRVGQADRWQPGRWTVAPGGCGARGKEQPRCPWSGAPLDKRWHLPL